MPNIIPLPYRILICIALIAAVFGFGWFKGSASVHADWDTAKQAQELANSNASTEQAEQKIQVVTQYVDRVQVVHEKGATITKEVKVYVPSDSCPLSGGFRVLHDAAAANQLPDPTRVADAPAADAQAVAATVTGNYETCNVIREQLIALQNWARGTK